jgi:Tfp pilus assembly protein PilN
MKRIRIDFAPPSLARTVFHTRPAAWALGLLALLLCLAAALAGWQLLSSRRAYEAQLNEARRRADSQAVAPAQAPPPLIAAGQAAAVNGAVLQLNLPWRELHDAVAAATPPTIALLALEPDARKRTIKLTAEARTGDEMIAYVEQLKRQELFAAVALSRHEINEGDPNRPIRFQLEAEWIAP